MPLVDYARTRRAILDVDLDADPFDRWQEIGRQQKTALGRFLRDVESMCHDLIGEKLPASPKREAESSSRRRPSTCCGHSRSDSAARRADSRRRSRDPLARTTPPRSGASPTAAESRRASSFSRTLIPGFTG
jgi:hypothetical protein